MSGSSPRHFSTFTEIASVSVTGKSSRSILIAPPSKPIPILSEAQSAMDKFIEFISTKLGNIRQLPLWVALMVLTIVGDAEAPEEAKYLLDRARAEDVSPESGRAIIDMVATIISYKFGQIS